MNVLITGGTGLIGSAFIRSHPEYHFLCLVHQNTDFPKNCTPVTSLSQITSSTQIDTIINLAGAPIDQQWNKKNKLVIEKSRLDTTKEIIQLIQRLEHKPKHLISASAIGVYLSSHTFSHQLCQQWESLACSANDLGIPTSIMRLGVILSHNQGLLKKLKLPYSLGLGGSLGPGTQTMNWMHIHDVIDAIDHLITTQKAGTFDFVAPEVVPQATFSQYYAESLNRPSFFRIPSWYIKCLFGQMGEELLLSSTNQQPEALLKTGFKFKYPKLKEALRVK